MMVCIDCQCLNQNLMCKECIKDYNVYIQVFRYKFYDMAKTGGCMDIKMTNIEKYWLKKRSKEYEEILANECDVNKFMLPNTFLYHYLDLYNCRIKNTKAMIKRSNKFKNKTLDCLLSKLIFVNKLPMVDDIINNIKNIMVDSCISHLIITKITYENENIEKIYIKKVIN